MRTQDGLTRPNAIAVDATAPETLGYVEVLAGRAPRAVTEVALTEHAMKRLGQGIGGTVTSGDGTRSYTVVGEVEFPSLLDEVVLFAPLPEVRAALGFHQEWLVDTPAPITWAQVRELNQSGIVVASRDVFIHPPPLADVPRSSPQDPRVSRELAVGVLVGGLALLEIVLLAGPAFAVSARRRQRQLALVAANGGTPAHVRRIVLCRRCRARGDQRGRRSRPPASWRRSSRGRSSRRMSLTRGPAATGSTRRRSRPSVCSP